MNLTKRQYLSLAKRHEPRLCRMTLPWFGHKADVTLGFEDTRFRGTWSPTFAQTLLKEARAIYKQNMKVAG